MVKFNDKGNLILFPMVCKTKDVKDDIVTYVFVIYYPIVVLISQQSKNSYTLVWYALNYSHKGINYCMSKKP